MNAMTKTLPATMAAMLLTGHGGPEKLVYRTDVKVPSPASGEVLVKVTAVSYTHLTLPTKRIV